MNTRTIEKSRKSLCFNGLRDFHILLIGGLVVVWSLSPINELIQQVFQRLILRHGSHNAA